VAAQRQKKHSPVRVKDPTSNSHAVFVVQNQKFEVFLSNDSFYDETHVKHTGDFLVMEGVRPANGGRIYTFAQTGKTADWHRVSTTFLGEVLLSNPKAKFSARLCVFLKSKNPYKTNVITVINPTNQTVKLQPYQVLEVVLFNPVYGLPLYWEADTTVDPRMELLAHCYINPAEYNPADSIRKITDAFFTLPRAPQGSSSRPFFEYHMWFRCNRIAAKHMAELPFGFFPDGKIRFNGCLSTSVKTTNELNIAFNIREQKDETNERIANVTYQDSDLQKDVSPMTQKGRKAAGRDIMLASELTRPPSRIYTPGTSDWNAYHRSGMSQYQYETSCPVNGPKYKPYNSIQSFRIEQIDSPIFENLPEDCQPRHFEDIKGDKWELVPCNQAEGL
jgi:hypothetical protein